MTKETMKMTTLSHPPRNRAFAALIATAAVVLALCAGTASAAVPAPGWTLDNIPIPTNFSAADNAQCLGSFHLPDYRTFKCDTYQVTVTNAGSQSADGSPITLTDALPPGLTVQRIAFLWHGSGAVAAGLEGAVAVDLATSGFCSATPAPSSTPVSCRLDTAGNGWPPVAPDDTLTMLVFVTVDAPGASGPLTNSATVTGGGAPDATAVSDHQISSAAPAFGLVGFASHIAGLDGRPDTQAAAHPYQFSTRIDLASEFRTPPDDNERFQVGVTSVEDLKDAVVDLPLGFLGSALATPTCTLVQLSGAGSCPAASRVGHLRTEPVGAPDGVDGPIFNLVPEHGVAAEFGFIDVLKTSHVLYARVVPSPDGYVLRTTAPDIPQVTLTAINATFYGNPVARNATGQTPVAMFTNPSSCDGRPLRTTVYVDSWQHPARFKADGTPDLSDANWASASSTSPPVTRCDKLRFSSSLSAQPQTTVADSPSGLDVAVKVPQSSDPATLATPPLKKAVVTLPAGFTVNPSSADGLGACSPAQIDLGSASSPRCPDSSKVGSVELESPLLPGTLKGSIYLATQTDNPFHSLLAGYIVVDDPTTGIVVKIPGNLTPDPITGQITGVFDNNPQFPFSELRLHFKGGSRGVLATPGSCGVFTTNAAFSPWSAPDSGPDSTPSDPFSITSGCVSGFSPKFTAGTTNPQAGVYSPFVLSFSRTDTDENLQGLSVTLPPGLVGKLAGVQQCSEAQLASISDQLGTGAAQAAGPSCPAASQVGTVTAGAGVGSSPFFIGGKAYLTGPYKGAPYGLAVVVPALAGPFDLGNVVVRQRLEIDPIDAHVTAISDPLPTILDGIPLRVRRVDVNLDRPSFTLNPTSCAAKQIQAQLVSTAGTLADLSAPFSVGGCGDLAYAPKLAISLTGKGQTTDDKHPGVHAVLTQPTGQANNKKVTVSLPLSLALDPDNAQSLCEFTDGSKADPTCPKGSIVGTATAKTPILDQPLTGPVYFVKNIRKDPKSGRDIRTLPKLVIPLTGPNGLRLTVTGTSNVVDNHLVSTFDNLPDAPVSDFTLDIDGGKHGILVVSGTDICKSTQTATRQADGQNGKTADASLTLSTPACPLKILSKKVGKTTVVIKVGGLGAGKVTVTGKGIKKTTKTIATSTVVTITAKRTKGKAGKVTVSFDPTGPAKAHKTSK
jgi:hypothetical protein